MKDILVVAAHPDDEVLGCGGTMARLATEGARLTVLILANGLTSRADFHDTEEQKLLQLHHARASRAGALLGVSEVKVLGFPDQKLDTLPLLEITQEIEREIRRVQPDTVFTQHGADLNMDHAITFRATLTATRPMQGVCVKRVYTYEVPSSTEWSFQKFARGFTPSVFFDISTTLPKKIDAMQVYETETRIYPHPRSPEALEAIAHRWGTVVGVRAAEAFELVREIR